MEQGVQIIALNSQNCDNYSILLKEFFRRGTKHCRGFRLKADVMKRKEREEYRFRVRPISCFTIRQYEES